MVEDLVKDIAQVRNEFKLELNHFREGLISVEEQIRERFDKVKETDLLSTMEVKFEDLIQRSLFTCQQVERNSQDLEKYQAEMEGGSSKMEGLERRLKDLEGLVEVEINDMKKDFDSRVTESE